MIVWDQRDISQQWSLEVFYLIGISPLLYLVPISYQILHNIFLQFQFLLLSKGSQKYWIDFAEIMQEDIYHTKYLLIILLVLIKHLLKNVIDNLLKLLFLRRKYFNHLMETANQLRFISEILIKQPNIHLTYWLYVVVRFR